MNYPIKQTIKRSICINLIAFQFYFLLFFTVDIVLVLAITLLFSAIPLLVLGVIFSGAKLCFNKKDLVIGIIIQSVFVFICLNKALVNHSFLSKPFLNTIFIISVIFLSVCFIFYNQDKNNYSASKTIKRTICINIIAMLWFLPIVSFSESSEIMKFLTRFLIAVFCGFALGAVFSFFKIYSTKKGLILGLFIQSIFGFSFYLIRLARFLIKSIELEYLINPQLFWKIIISIIVSFIFVCCILPNQEQS